MIARSTIDKVFDAARVEEVIGDFVQLKKSGSNFKGLSPFTDERTPSFMVSPVKQIWKDFSSGKGGNVVAFLMEHEHFTYPEAIRYLARKYQIEIEETQRTDEEKEQASERESMLLVSEFARDFFQECLWETETGKAIGLSYFKERGFSEDTIREFGLGYNPDQWSAFTDAALEKGYQLEFLEKTGLTIVKPAQDPGQDPRKFDRFKGRVLFPIQSMSGRVLGFGGRTLSSEKKVAKYLNSPESEIYHKSKVLYGIYHAKKAIARDDVCYLVEGYTDVIQLYQSGIENVVASSGTALTPDQIRLIRRLTKNVVVLFDGDAAGLRASLRGIDLILEEGLNVRVCSFPEGEDPDSFARAHSRDAIEAYLKEHARDFIQFKTALLTKEAADDPIRRAETIRDIVSSISRIPDRIKQEVYVQECASLMGISEQVLFNTLAQMSRKAQRDASRKPEQRSMEVVRQEPAAEKVDPQYELERKIIEVLLLYGQESEEFEDLILKENEQGELVLEPERSEAKVFEKIFLDLQEDEIELSHDRFRSLYYKLIEKLNSEPEFSVQSLTGEADAELAGELSTILMEDEKYELHHWERKDIFPKQKQDSLGQLVSETILSLRCYLIQKRIDALRGQTESRPGETNAEILEEIINYLHLNKLLNKKLNRVLS
ncbi:DNA primase [Robiginitalea sp. SC105]|uniref:DNA primase n=1 Tax=Robiginitalea sp. SC105 TaxID=2762332 RepID=UPI001639D595|nr:DNA primase [Robiginitalea sp. SC105]MBC2838966.1 DNA primase [Robiginitalea sp. SC105]